jgi:hypothetical protein
VSVAAALFFAITTPVGAQSPRIPVMIVGVAHLVAHRDVHNSTFTDDPLSPKRQAQIDDVVARLARFSPTKVLVEGRQGDAVLEKRYRDYVAGSFTLPANEVYQFGFRLAARAHDDAVYPVDTFGPSLISDETAAGKEIDAFLQQNLANVSYPGFQAYLTRSDELERSGTYLDLLRFLNTDGAIRANAGWYSVVDGMGRDVHQAGTAYAAQWYIRNCYIFANILDVIRPGDRVVVLFGQGHEYLLRELVQLNPNLLDVDPLTYLQ